MHRHVLVFVFFGGGGGLGSEFHGGLIMIMNNMVCAKGVSKCMGCKMASFF